MEIYNRSQVTGNHVDILTSNSKHIDGKEPPLTPPDSGGVRGGGSPDKEFSDLLFKLVDSVNQSQLNADDLEQKMIVSPEEVNIHEVMIASEKARLSMTFFKSITEKAIKAYNDIMMLR